MLLPSTNNKRKHNHFQPLDQLIDTVEEIELNYFASDLLQLGFNDLKEIEEAVNRSLEVCRAASIPLKTNYKKVYRCKNGILISDWLVSEMGRHLILINGKPNNPFAAQSQVKLIQQFKTK